VLWQVARLASSPPMAGTDTTLAQRLLAGDKRALARAITLVENDDPAGWELVREVYPHTGRAVVVGFTGPPGVGKSTLLSALTVYERARERTVSVLSIDPSSPFTHGALLGDRLIEVDRHPDDGKPAEAERRPVRDVAHRIVEARRREVLGRTSYRFQNSR